MGFVQIYVMKKIAPTFIIVLFLAVCGYAGEVLVDNRLGVLSVDGITELVGGGGVVVSSLNIPAGASLVLDPVATPIKVSGTPVFAEGAKIALSSDYAEVKLGKIVLMTYAAEAVIPNGLFDVSSVANESESVLSQELAPDGTSIQLILTVGDYERDAKEIVVAPVGDSITQGIKNEGRGDYPQYRSAIAARLAANGYKPKFKGIWRKSNLDAAGVQIPDDWAYHSAFGGAKVRTSSLQCGVAENMPLYLDIAGYPDVITLLIGTNDLGEENAESVFGKWVSLVKATAEQRPDAKIIGATILPHASSSGHEERIQAFNELLRAEYAKEGKGELPDNFHLLDLYPLVPPDETADDLTGNYKRDNFHPNWAGNAIIAKAFFSAITNACPCESFAGVGDSTITDEPQSALGVAGVAATDPSFAVYTNGMVHAFTIDKSGEDGAANSFASAPYTWSVGMDHSQRIAKVGYFMELVRKGTNRRRWVWVDMDARGKTLGEVDFPWDDGKMQYVAKKLHVKSNFPGIHDVAADDDSVCGIVEGTRCNYSAGKETGGALDVSGVPENLMQSYGWNDTMGSGGLGYGCFQVHRIFSQTGEDSHWNDAEVLFAWNRWGVAGYADDIGIGTYACYIHESGNIRTMDYTLTNVEDGNFGKNISSEAYSVRHFEIWVKPVILENGQWIYENSDNGMLTGVWSQNVNYLADGRAFIDGREEEIFFTPYSSSTGNLVTVTAKMQFCKYPEDPVMDQNVQAAVRMSESEVFQVWSSGVWVDVEAEGIVPEDGMECVVRLLFDYSADEYSAEIMAADAASPSAAFLKFHEKGRPSATSFPLGGSANCVSSFSIKGDTYLYFLSGECRMVVLGFAKDETVVLKDNAQVVLDAAKAAWLNKCALGDKAAVKNAAASLSGKEFSDAFLLNLDIADSARSYSFEITDVDVGSEEVTVCISLKRSGVAGDSVAPINGVLKFYGAETLAEFRSETLSPLDAQLPVDEDFSEGDSVRATFRKSGKNFFRAKIEEKLNLTTTNKE